MQGFTPCQCYQINQLLGAKLIVAKGQHLLEICIARMKIFFKFFSSPLKFFFAHSSSQSRKRFPYFFLMLVSNIFPQNCWRYSWRKVWNWPLFDHEQGLLQSVAFSIYALHDCILLQLPSKPPSKSFEILHPGEDVAGFDSLHQSEMIFVAASIQQNLQHYLID